MIISIANGWLMASRVKATPSKTDVALFLLRTDSYQHSLAKNSPKVAQVCFFFSIEYISSLANEEISFAIDIRYILESNSVLFLQGALHTL